MVARANDRCIRKRLLHELLTGGLRAVECGLGVVRGVEVGDMDEALNTALSGDGRNSLGTLGMDIVVAEVPVKRACSRQTRSHE